MSKSETQFNQLLSPVQGNLSTFFICGCIILTIAILTASKQKFGSLFSFTEAATPPAASTSLNYPSVSALDVLPCGVSHPSQGSVFTAEPWLVETIELLWQQESSGRLNPPVGDDGRAVGPLQIHMCVLTDVNKYYGTNFKSVDRKYLTKSKQIAAMYIAMWQEIYKREIAVRIFNGGSRGWRKTSTNKYWNDVRKLARGVR